MDGLFVLKGNEIRKVRTLTAQEAQDYHDACEHIHSFNESLKIFELAEINRDDLFRTLTRISEALTAGEKGFDSEVGSGFEINRLLINYLATATLFIENVFARLTRVYGRSSEELARFQAAVSDAEESDFAFNLLRKIRDYAQHVGLPIQHIRSTSSLEPRTGQTTHVLTVKFDSRSLLATGGWSWEDFEAKLKARPRYLDVEDHVDQFHNILRDLRGVFIEVERPALTGSGEDIVKVVGDNLSEDHNIAVGELDVQDGERVNVDLKRPPFAILCKAGIRHLRWR